MGSAWEDESFGIGWWSGVAYVMESWNLDIEVEVSLGEAGKAVAAEYIRLMLPVLAQVVAYIGGWRVRILMGGGCWYEV